MEFDNIDQCQPENGKEEVLSKLTQSRLLRHFDHWAKAFVNKEMKADTLPKFNMEPENGTLEEEIPFGHHHF